MASLNRRRVERGHTITVTLVGTHDGDVFIRKPDGSGVSGDFSAHSFLMPAGAACVHLNNRWTPHDTDSGFPEARAHRHER